MVRFEARYEEDARYSTNIPADLRGSWCRIRIDPPAFAKSITLRIDIPSILTLGATDCWWSASNARPISGTVFLPSDADTVQLDFFGMLNQPEKIVIGLQPISRGLAASVIALQNPGAMIKNLWAGKGPFWKRFRKALPVITAGAVPQGYENWIALFDTWYERDHHVLLGSQLRPGWPTITGLVFRGDASSDALAATEASLAAQILPAPYFVITDTGSFQSAVHGLDTDYVAVLQAGEVLPGHALALLADWAASKDGPRMLCADEDALTEGGKRVSHNFKPEPNHALMLSGTLSTGVWLIRRDAVVADFPSPWAEAVRLRAWLALYEKDGARDGQRVPYVLTHVRWDTPSAPHAVLKAVVEEHIARTSIPASVRSVERPLLTIFKAHAPGTKKVSIIIPSGLRNAHVRRCLMSVLSRTEYPDFEMVIVASQQTPLDDAQSRTLAGIRDDPRVKVVQLNTASFNYSVANNHGVGQSDGEFICLLNDDIEVIDVDWLLGLSGHLADPRVGLAGCKLLYPNGTIQHDGVIMGFAGFCDHAYRHAPSSEPGYAWRAILNQELSAVTGACILTRREIYAKVGGLDESLPSAFNDVDFCLKVQAAGFGIILSAQTRLVHYESLSFGKHYSDDERDRELRDVARLRQRWKTAATADPYYNPNLSLTIGNEWTPAFPPRVGKWLRLQRG